MSIRAGHIVFVGGRNVIDRLQQSALSGNIPIETVREIGNDLVVDKVPGESDYTFTMENWDVTTDMIAFLQGAIGAQAVDQPPGHGDAAHTEYKWEDCGYVNILSPWKNDTGSAGGHIGAGVIIPTYYPTRLRYRLGVTEAAQQTVELRGGDYYYAQGAPVEETATGDGATTAFTTSEDAMVLRLGGPAGTAYQHVFGVLVDGVPAIKDVDYTESGGLDPAATEGDEVQTLTVTGTPTGGSFDLLYPGKDPITVPYNSNSATLQGLLNGIFGGGNTLVSGGALPGAGLVITFQGALADTAVPLPVIDDVALAGGATPHAHIVASTVGAGAATPVTITFTTAPASTAVIRFTYFSTTAKTYPQSVNADATVKPGQVRGRDIVVLVNGVRLPGTQSFELDATVAGNAERMMGTSEITGWSVEGTDVTGNLVFRPKDRTAFFDALHDAIGVDKGEVFRDFYTESVPVEIQIHNPKNFGEILKTLYVSNGQLQPPPLAPRVNQPLDFTMQFNAVNGTYSEFKGGRP